MCLIKKNRLFNLLFISEFWYIIGDLNESFYIGPIDDGDTHNDVN